MMMMMLLMTIIIIIIIDKVPLTPAQVLWFKLRVKLRLTATVASQ